MNILMKTHKNLLLCLIAALGFAVPAAEAITPKSQGPLHRNGHTTIMRRLGTRIPDVSNPPQLRLLSEQQRRVTAGGTALYGYLVAGHSGHKQGLYALDHSGVSLMWHDPLFTYDRGYATLQTAWRRNGKICGFDHWFNYGYFWGQQYYELDFNSGQLTAEAADEDCIDKGWFVNACYDSDSDTVYGYGTDDEDESSTALFMKTSGANPFDYQIIRDYGTSPSGYRLQCISMCYNEIDKNLYGINLDRQFVRIDKATGEQTVLFNVPVTMGLYVTGLAYSPLENLYYWNCNYDNSDGSWGSDLYTIDAITGTFTRVGSFDGGDSFSVLFVDSGDVDTEAPRRPEFVRADFAPGSTSGTLTFRMPVEKISGRAIDVPLTWALAIDRRPYSDGVAAAGAEVTVAVTDIASGLRTFAMTASAGSHTSPECTASFHVGSDRPKAPALVILEEKTIRWSAVREGENGGYIDTEMLEYEVSLNGEPYAVTRSNAVALTLPEGAPVQKWRAAVTAVCGTQRSDAAYSNTIVAGEAWQMPVNVTCDQETLDLTTIVNVNRDDETWTYTDWENGWYSGQVDNGSGTGDDWVILPAIHFPDADRHYSFYIDCMKKANVYPETWIEVCYGVYPDPAMMDGNVILERFSPPSRDYHRFGNPAFKVPAAGDYYIGIRCITHENHLGCIVGSIRIEDNNYSPQSPAAVGNLTATPGGSGALCATIAFTMPTKTVGGTDIPAETSLTATVTGCESAFLTGKPGQAMSATVKTVQGDNEISVVVTDGDYAGERAYVNVYTGVSIPGSVRDLRGEISHDMSAITLSWQPPISESAGGYVDPATVTYYFAIKNPATGVFEKTFAGTGIVSGTYILPADWPQDIYQIGIATENAAGSNGKVMVLQAHMGQPWPLPMSETFEDEGFMYQPWASHAVSGSSISWGLYRLRDIATEWADLTSIALVGYGRANTAAESLLALPRFSTEGLADATLRIKYWAGDQAADLSVRAAVYGMEESELIHTCTLLDSDVWLTVDIPLPSSYLDRQWVQLYLDAVFGQSHNYCIIEELSVESSGSVISMFDPVGNVAGGRGYISVSGYAGCLLSIHTPAGVKVADSRLTGGIKTIAVSPGIYIVSVAGKTVKILVR